MSSQFKGAGRDFLVYAGLLIDKLFWCVLYRTAGNTMSLTLSALLTVLDQSAGAVVFNWFAN